MLKEYFAGNTYDTPENTPRRFMDKLFLNTRWYFVWGYINEIIKGRSIAVKGRYDTKEWAESSYNTFELIEGCGGRFHITGLDNIRKLDAPVVFISNHMSTLETFVFPCIIAPIREVTFAVKKSLTTHALFGPVMRARDPIVVGRQNPKEDLQTVMTKGKELLENGTSVIIFPQSTRTAQFIPAEFNTLGVKLAKTAGVKVVPVAIKTDFWGNGKYLKDLGVVDRNKPIYIEFGEPLSISGTGKEEHTKIVEFISTRVKAWGGVVKESEKTDE